MTNAELIATFRAEIERLKSLAEQMDYQKAVGFNWALDDILSFLSDLEKSEKLNVTNWEQIEKRAKVSEKALDYMREHPLTHKEAVEQTRWLKEKLEND